MASVPPESICRVAGGDFGPKALFETIGRLESEMRILGVGPEEELFAAKAEEGCDGDRDIAL